MRVVGRRPAVLALLLLSAGVLNYALGAALLPPIAAALLLPRLLGDGLHSTLASLCVCAVCAESIVGAARETPWAPTPAADMIELLRLGDARPGLAFLELGSGDGRNLLLAAEHGLRAIGVERSPILCAASRVRAALARRDVAVVNADFGDDADWRRAIPPHGEVDLIYVYLSREALADLGPRLRCAYGGRGRKVRLLSRDFEVQGWGEPQARVQRGRTALLVWTVPAPSKGSCA